MEEWSKVPYGITSDSAQIKGIAEAWGKARGLKPLQDIENSFYCPPSLRDANV